MAQYINLDEFNAIKLSDFLAALGHYPVRRSGKELYYHSMLRHTSQNTPSFTVWDEGGKWIDHAGPNSSGIIGGGILQLALAYWPEYSFRQVLLKIKDTLGLPLESPLSALPPSRLASLIPKEPDYAFALAYTRPIGSNYLLSRYLKSRGVLQQAKKYMKEIYYRRKGAAQGSKMQFAIGWLNEHGNWEFSSTHGFKSSIGKKGLSIIAGSNPGRALVFEGFMDFLSWLKLSPLKVQQSPSIFVLNSIVNLKRLIGKVKHFSVIELYLDNDAAGRNATTAALAQLPQAVDCSMSYYGYKDYNELLLSYQSQKRQRAAQKHSPAEFRQKSKKVK